MSDDDIVTRLRCAYQKLRSVVRLRRICSVHPFGTHKGQTLYFYQSTCPTCRPDGWIHVPSAEAPRLSAEASTELLDALRRYAKSGAW